MLDPYSLLCTVTFLVAQLLGHQIVLHDLSKFVSASILKALQALKFRRKTISK